MTEANPNPNRKLSPLEKQRIAVEQRVQGKHFDEIAAYLGYANAGGAYKAYRKAMERAIQQPAQEILKLELRRLDDMFKAIWPLIEMGSDKHVHAGIRIMERRAKLTGIDNLNMDPASSAAASLLVALADQLGEVPDTYGQPAGPGEGTPDGHVGEDGEEVQA